jgi:hypothetical protein
MTQARHLINGKVGGVAQYGKGEAGTKNGQMY